MKKTKLQKTEVREVPWWPLAGSLAAFVALWVVYGPALHGPFVFDDRFLPFQHEETASRSFLQWVTTNRPLLMATFWLNFRWGGTDPLGYHVVNVFLHAAASGVVGLILARLLSFVGVNGAKRTGLAMFGAVLFLLHPLQTESVAYVVSRSETLSVLLYYGAFALFLYRPEGGVSWGRAVCIGLFMATALSTKEHTLTLPLLLLLTDWFFNPKGIRENLRGYGVLATVMAGGGWAVWAVLRAADSAGFSLERISPLTYAFTQCRVIWTYVRLFFLPYGQNLDPDVALSRTVLEHGALVGLLALLASVAWAFVYRKRWPLACYGWLMFLLLLGPTSSIVPILDPLAEHRLYLPAVGLILIALEALRRVTAAQATWVCLAALAACSALTFQRNTLWGDPVLLWTDAAAKSPRKMRPNFQLGYALYQRQRCAEATRYFELAASLEKPNPGLLVDWALNYECLGRYDDGIAVLRRGDQDAAVLGTIAILYGAQMKWPEVLATLDAAEKADPNYPYTYAYRGDYYEVQGDYAAAAAEFRRAIALAPWLTKAHNGLARVTAGNP